MEKKTVADFMPATPDLNRERLDQLKQLMPDLFTADGQLNPDELKRLVDPSLVAESERYEFRWFGKASAKRTAYQPSLAGLEFDPKRSVNPDAADGNAIIEGENLETLKCLLAAYRNKIKCIYIDPPYNTGKDFVYSDDWKTEKETYWEHIGVTENGVKIDTNTRAEGRFHSNWLNLIYSRLLLARALLLEDGVIFISIDDNEVHHLRKLCDEVFGEDNFVAQLIWKKRSTPPNDKIIGAQHEYILVYAKSEHVGLFLRERTPEQIARYKNPDNHPKGPWTAGDLMANVKGGRYVKSLYYPIVNPHTGEEHYPSSNGNWRFNKEKIQELMANDEIYFGEDGKGRPKLKRFLNDVKSGITWTTLWDFVPLNTAGSSEMTQIFGNMITFENPKPSGLVKNILKAGCGDDDVILDFFAGSGTTGQAVMELNAEDGGNRKFILVQLPETTDEKSEAFKAGFKKISDITIERCKRVAERIAKEKPEHAPGFKVYRLAQSRFPRVEFLPDPELSEEENVERLKQYIREKESAFLMSFQRDEIMQEVLLKNGFKLNVQVQPQPQFKKNAVFLADDGYKKALICFDYDLKEETIAGLTDRDRIFICLEQALDTTAKWNLRNQLGEKFIAF